MFSLFKVTALLLEYPTAKELPQMVCPDLFTSYIYYVQTPDPTPVPLLYSCSSCSFPPILGMEVQNGRGIGRMLMPSKGELISKSNYNILDDLDQLN